MHIVNKTNAVVPTNDYVFKRIFGQVGNEDITKGFLSSILDIKLESIYLNENTILEKDLYDEKIGILDVKAKLNNQAICDIEMQVVNHKDIEKRILFYWSKLYCSGIKAGEDYNKLNKTICILLANFELKNLKEILKGHTEWKIREKEYKNTVLTEMLEIHIIELPKVKRMIDVNKEISRDKFSNWIKFLLTPNELEEKDMNENEEIKKAKEELEKIQNDEYEQRMAELRMKHIRDMKAVKAYGYDEGMIEGINKGISQGISQGEKNAKIKIAKNLLSKGLSLEEIMEITELSKEEIENF